MAVLRSTIYSVLPVFLVRINLPHQLLSKHPSTLHCLHSGLLAVRVEVLWVKAERGSEYSLEQNGPQPGSGCDP